MKAEEGCRRGAGKLGSRPPLRAGWWEPDEDECILSSWGQAGEGRRSVAEMG